VVGLRLHGLLLRHNFRRKLINVVFCLLGFHFKFLEGAKLVRLRHREHLRLGLALSRRLHRWLAELSERRWLVSGLLELSRVRLWKLTTVHGLLRLTIRRGIVGDLHFLLALLVILFGLDFLRAESEEVLELLNVVVVLFRLIADLFAHVKAVTVPGFLAGTLVRNHRAEILRQRVVVGILIADAATCNRHHLHHHGVDQRLLLREAHEAPGLRKVYSWVDHGLHPAHLHCLH
jgi:hypothetical protein